MEFSKSWNKFANLSTLVVFGSLFPVAYLIIFLISIYSPLPEFPEVSYFLMLLGFSISFLAYGYLVLGLSIWLWLKYALKHHTKSEILSGIEAKFTSKAAIYKCFQRALRNT